MYYLVLVCVQVWMTIWFVYYTASQYNSAVAILQGLDGYGKQGFYLVFTYRLLSLATWIALPSILHTNPTFINTVQYLKKKPKVLSYLNLSYSILYILLLVPQLTFVSMAGIPTIINKVVPSLPWYDANSKVCTYFIN